MRQPRVEYFDPKVVHPLKSSLDDMPRIQSPSRKSHGEKSDIPTKTETLERRPLYSTVEPTTERPSVRPSERIKRTLTRYSFEFFQDQIERLKKLSLEEQIRGEKGNMSKMVREALDTYIAKRMRTNE
jgi:hypothetical protein